MKIFDIKEVKGQLGNSFKDININLFELVDCAMKNLSKEDKFDFIRSLSLDDDIIECVKDRLLGADLGFSSYKDEELRISLFEKYTKQKFYNSDAQKLLLKMQDFVNKFEYKKSIYEKLLNEMSASLKDYQYYMDELNDLGINDNWHLNISKLVEEMKMLHNEFIRLMTLQHLTNEEYDLMYELESKNGL